MLLRYVFKEIGRKLREKILNESNYFQPNIGNKILSIKKISK